MASAAERRPPQGSPITPADRLAFTLVMALLVHALVLFGIRFVVPKTQAAPVMEVTLVPAKSAKAPVRADFLAQAQQEGSGTLAEARLLTTRERTPLPGQGRGAQPVTPKVPEAVAAVSEQKQPTLITTRQLSTPVSTAQALATPVAPPVPPSPDLDADIAALEARLSASKQAYAKRPRIRTLAAVSTRQDDWAGYIDQFRQRVETTGNASFPAEARAQHLQGQVRLLVAIYPDGRVQRIQILQSSGHAILDRAAEQSVRQAEPFARFPASQQGQVDVLQIIRTWRFADTLATGV
ncbi:MAG: TonB family protein [Pseudomonadota bacterium]